MRAGLISAAGLALAALTATPTPATAPVVPAPAAGSPGFAAAAVAGVPGGAAPATVPGAPARGVPPAAPAPAPAGGPGFAAVPDGVVPVVPTPGASARAVAPAPPAPVGRARFTAVPGTVAPGDTVTLRAAGCDGPATASAPGLFGTVALGPGGGAAQSATVTVGRYAEPGTRHAVTFACAAARDTVPLAVEDRGLVAPGAVRTGLGGGVTGPGSVKAVAVGALVGATGLVVVRRRRTAR